MRVLRFLLLSLFILSGCAPSQPAFIFWLPWQLSDLRLLKSPDTPDPTSDLIAIYSRMNGEKFQIRLDLLELQPDLKFDVFILLDTSIIPNPNKFPASPSVLNAALATRRWDWLFIFPNDGKPRAYQSGSLKPVAEMTTSLQRDLLMDAITITLDPARIPDTTRLKLAVFITSPGGRVLLDQSPPISVERAPGMPKAPLLLAFSDVFPAVTPAQALRRWDGAHTGPTGSRHGLEHVLSSMDTYNVPVALIDLLNPTNLSALDFMNGTSMIQDLVDRDLLLIPEFAIAKPASFDTRSSRRAALAFDLPGSLFSYAIDSTLQPVYIYQFSALPDRTHLLRQSGRVLIPLPDLSQTDSTSQATVDGLALDVRRLLISTALSPDPTDLVVLGGSLPHSTWGNAESGSASFAYIATHPWIQPLNGDQLQTLGSLAATQIIDPQPAPIQHYPIYASNGQTIGFDSSQLVDRLKTDLNKAPQNSIRDNAWLMFNTLASPAEDELTSSLNFQYINQVESLLAASHWAEDPTSISDCNQDIDLDLIRECILADRNFFAIFEIDGGRLSFLFTQRDGQIHQLVGPQSQLTVGLSDSSLWDIHLGPGADPSEIPGAFSDLGDPFAAYNVTILGEETLTLTRSDGLVQKTFHLLENGLSMDCSTKQAVTLSIALVLDPHTRFQTGWQAKYNSLSTDGFYRWGIKDSLTIEIRSSAPLRSHDFTESRSLLSSPENPDQNYPAGHFLPFPLALVEISGNGKFSVQILLNP